MVEPQLRDPVDDRALPIIDPIDPIDLELVGLQFARLDASVPLFLLPIRIETRYRPADQPTQLLVRIYPDQIHIQRDVPPLTASEHGLAIDFWNEWTRAGDASARTKAWRRLTESTGARRARQITNRIRPTMTTAGKVEFPAPPRPAPPTPPAPAHAALLPRQWVVAGYDRSGNLLFQQESGPVTANLATGPTAAAPTWDIAASGVVVDDGLAWMVDYERALEAGMAVTIDLTGPAGAAADGVATLVVTGVNADLDRDAAVDALTAVLEAHDATDGLAFVAQGTPTNNTDEFTSGWTTVPGEPVTPPLAATPASRQLSDVFVSPDNATRFSRLLGLGDDARWRALPGGADAEFADSQAMRIAMFEVVLGVLTRQLLDVGEAAGLADGTVNDLRAWFIDHVTGGAPVPTIRVGTQPYGILPVRVGLAEPDLSTVVGRVEQVTGLLAAEWQGAVATVPTIDHGATDSSTDLPVESVIAAVLAGQPHPARLQWRRLDSYDTLNGLERWVTPQFFYELALSALSPVTNPNFDAPISYVTTLYGSLAADNPLDTIERQLELWQGMEDGFPEWLDTQGGEDPDGAAIGFIRSVRSVLESYADRQYPLQYLGIDLLSAVLAHPVTDGELTFESPVNTSIIQAILYASSTEWGDVGLIETPDAEDTHSAATYLSELRRVFDQRNDEFVNRLLLDEDFLAHPPLLYQLVAATDSLVPHLPEVERRFSDALDRLSGLDPSTLEWLLRESLGLGMHRLDAWHTSIAASRLDRVRAAQPSGVQIGAFGVAIDLAPSQADEPSQGFVHAPSMVQAATASLLRAGWSAHGDDDPESAFAIDLSSRRVRDARWLLDGIVGGQPLGDVLGYRFERALHDAGKDRFIRSTRQAVLDALGRPNASVDQPVDGIELLDLVRAGTVTLAAEARTALDEVEAAFDATNDVALAEGVHQLAAGNYGRASAMLDAVATGTSRPPDPEFVHTHGRGTSIEHRVAILLPATAKDDPSNGWVTGLRDSIAPQLEVFVASLLPTPTDVGFTVSNADQITTMTLAELGLSALDAVHLVAEDPSQPSGPLTTLVACVSGIGAAEVDAVSASHTPISLAEFGVLAVEIRRLIDRARVADARDMRPAADAGEDTIDVTTAVAALDALVANFTGVVAALRAATSDGDSGDLSKVVAPVARFGFACPGDPSDVVAARAVLATAEGRLAQIDGAPPASRPPSGSGIPTFPPRPPSPGPLRPGQLERPVEPVDPAVPVAPTDDERVALLFSHQVPLLGTFVLSGASTPDALALPDPNLASADEIDEWLDAVGRVRPEVGRLTHVGLLADTLAGRSYGAIAGQCPRIDGEAWSATHLPTSTGGRLAVTAVVGPSGPPSIDEHVCALVIDRWVEQIPASDQVTGVAFHFDAPSNQAPQTCLLAVTPEDQPWSLSLVLATLLETLDWMRIRAVAPEDLTLTGRSIPSSFVPGALTPWTEDDD